VIPTTDAGVRSAASEAAGAQQIQTVAAVSAKSAEASLMTMLPTKAVLAPAIEATATTPFMMVADVVIVINK
jgi:hypothetical protein